MKYRPLHPPSLQYCQDLWEEPPEEYPEWLQEVDTDNQEIPLDDSAESE